MTKSFYKCQISFKGTKYLGWQKQKSFSPTVQEIFNNAATKIFKSDDITSVACGRTDSGVHAFDMSVKLTAPFHIDPDGLVRAFNSKLDNEIKVNQISLCDESFRPTFDAKSREYFYLFTNRESLTPFESDLIAKFRGDLNINKIQEVLGAFVGEHNFINYMCVGSDPSSTTREIFSASIEKVEASFHSMIGEHYKITISGNGFLKQMVRLMVGVAVSYGQDKISLKDIESSLLTAADSKLAPVAPACGLYKSKVHY